MLVGNADRRKCSEQRACGRSRGASTFIGPRHRRSAGRCFKERHRPRLTAARTESGRRRRDAAGWIERPSLHGRRIRNCAPALNTRPRSGTSGSQSETVLPPSAMNARSGGRPELLDQTELSRSQPTVPMAAVAVTGHSTIDLSYDCFTFETGYSAIVDGRRALNDRLRSGPTGTHDP
jgi:hypothetical protein